MGCASPGSSALDLEGHRLDPISGNAVTALIFISNDCPISNRYVPEIKRLQEEFAARGVSFYLVHADPTETAAEIRDHAQRFGLTMPELRDPSHHLATLSHAEVTPTAAVFAQGGQLVYHGRIDDRVSDLGGREHVNAVRRDLAEALDDVLAGREVRVAETRAVGCYIPTFR